jgi:hypothetical protein
LSKDFNLLKSKINAINSLEKIGPFDLESIINEYKAYFEEKINLRTSIVTLNLEVELSKVRNGKVDIQTKLEIS